MKKIFSFFAAMMLLVSTASATTVYCKMTQSWWTADGAAVAVHHWGGETAGTTWPGVRMAPVTGEEGVWSYDVPADITGLIFVRVNASGDIADWGAKTKDLTLPTDGKNLFTITNEEPTWGSPGCDGVWSVYNAWAEIAFTEAVTADDLAPDASFSAKAGENMFTITVTDPDNKMAIDANPARFGTAEAYTDYTHRLKSGGKSSATKNFITATIPADGQLRIAVRTGSNSATDRNLVIMQGETELYNKAVVEADTIEGVSPRTYKYITVDVKAGSAVLSYPTNGLNFYAFAFKAAAVEPQPQPESPITETYFATGDGWAPDTESSATWNAEAKKVTVTIAMDKVAQWQAQVKYQALASEPGKFYHFGVKMKANNAVTGITVKWDDNTGLVLKEGVALAAGTELVIDLPQVASNAAGNGVIVFDFGFAKAGDVIEIYDVVVEEVAAPTINLEDGFYVIGLNGWSIYDLTAADKLAANGEVENEYVITKTLAAGNEFKVVAVANDTLGAWYPGEAGNYVVDAAHAGEKAIYFRPNYDGAEDWYAGCIYIVANEGPVSPINSTWFADANWQEEHESTIVWDPETGKITITVAVNKNAQWQGQLKLNTIAAEEGKCYKAAFNLKANNAVTGITFKWQDNNNDPNLIYENQTISLQAGVEYGYEVIVAGIPGNGIAVFDFGFAKAGDIIELSNFAITEVECPDPEVNVYLVGSMNNWEIVKEAQYEFAVDTTGDYLAFKLATTLAEGDEFKVVTIVDEETTWFPDGMNNNYVVDAAHAGNVTIYFRPDGEGGEGWHYGYIYVDVPQAIENTAAEMKAVKTVINGQLVIIKGDKIYNATGAQIR